MMQCPPVEKGQKAPGNSSWQGQSKIVGSSPASLSRTIRSFKLPIDSSLGSCNESLSYTKVSQVHPLPGELRRVLRTGRSQEDSPVVELTASEFRGPRVTFLVKPGFDVNLVKLHALRQDMIIEPLHSILITGITNDPVKTIGIVRHLRTTNTYGRITHKFHLGIIL